MYKLVAIDLDGTMLDSFGQVTENTKKAIQKTIEKGIDVIIASGRPIDSIKTIAKEIGSNKYFIAGNGALIYDIQKDEVLYENYMNKQKVLEIIKICEENSIAYNVYTDKTILATSLKYNVLYYHKENLKKQEDKRTHINIVENMYEYIQKMHEKGLLVWANSIVYDENEIISAGFTDDISLELGGDRGWGELAGRGFDFIQTDWLYAVKCYLTERKK